MLNAFTSKINKSLVYAFLSIFIFLLFAKAIALAKDIRIAYVFGTTSALDEYFYIFNNSIVFVGLWLSILTVVLLPLLIKSKDGDRDSDKIKLLNLIDINFTVSVIFSFLFCAYLVFFDSYFAQSKLYFENLTLAFCVIFFGFNASFFSVVLMSRSDNKNSLLESFPSLVVLILLLANPIDGFVYVGTIVGFILYFSSTLLIMVEKLNLNLRIPMPAFHVEESLISFMKSFSLLLVGQLIISFAVLIDQYYLSFLEPGSLTSFNYSAKILSLITGISSIVLSRTLIPYYSKFDSVSKLLIFKTTFFVLLTCTVLTYFSGYFSVDIVSILFGYGNFKTDSINQVASLLATMLYQAPFFIASMVLLSYFSSINYFLPFFITGFTAVIFKVFYLYLMQNELDSSVVAESTVIMYLGNFLVLVLFLFKSREKV